MKELKGRRRGEEVIDGGRGRGAGARWQTADDEKLQVWTPLMKGKRQHAFPSLALISPLSGGSAVSALRRRPGRGRCTTGRKRGGVERKEKTKGVGGYLFLLCCWQRVCKDNLTRVSGRTCIRLLWFRAYAWAVSPICIYMCVWDTLVH